MQLSDRVRSIGRQETIAELPRLALGTTGRRNPQDLGDRLLRRQDLDVTGVEGRGINAGLVDGTHKPASRPAAGADPQRLLALERLIQLIEQHLDGRELAVDIDLHPRRDARAVVGDGDVRPLFGGDDRCRLDADRVVQPALHEVDLDLASVEYGAVTLAFRQVDHPREDGPPTRAGGLDPGARA